MGVGSAFQRRTYTVAASTPPRPAAPSQRSAHFSAASREMGAIDLALPISINQMFPKQRRAALACKMSLNFRRRVPWIYDTFTAARPRLDSTVCRSPSRTARTHWDSTTACRSHCRGQTCNQRSTTRHEDGKASTARAPRRKGGRSVQGNDR